jgi:tRNA pseudouridine55 synthase
MVGFLNLNKPSGMTSRKVVDCVVRLLPRVRVGHAGTLDPLASGVLVVGLGTATRLIERVQQMPKTYHAIVRLGARSNTLDADGAVTILENPRTPTKTEVLQFLETQVGEIRQLPPEFSALKVKGHRAHDLARAGHPVQLEPRPVRVYRTELIEYHWPELTFEIECGAGTYIRSIARDLGEALGCGGFIQKLVRTRIGPYSVQEATDLDLLTADSLPRHLRPLSDAVRDLPSIYLDEDQVAVVAHGRALDAGRLCNPAIPLGEVALVGPDGRLIALGQADVGLRAVRPIKVLI